jgi:DNA modification methylase
MVERLGVFKINKTYLGDAMILAKELPDESVDLIVTSPPYADTLSYGNNVKVFHPERYVDWFLPLFHEARRFLKDTGSFILNINDKAVNGERDIYVFELVTRIVKETGLKLFDRYIWYKKSALPTPGNKRLNDRVEYIFHFVKDSKKFKMNMDRIRVPYKEISLRRFQNKVHGNDIINPKGITQLSHRDKTMPHPLGTKPVTVFQFDTGSALRGHQHPAPFHPQLPEFFIRWLTDEGDLILDPFMGGGTVAEVALNLNRNYLGFEKSPTYLKMTYNRIKNYKKVSQR